MSPTLGVVVMAYGTPATPDDLEAYYTHIRRGRPPTPEQLATLRARYDAIGGSSGLRERTEAQVAALQAALDRRAPGRCQVVLGQKHAAPFIEDAVATLGADGIVEAVGLVLAPHYSGFSVGEYQARATEAGVQHGIALHRVDRWSDLPAWVAFQAAAVRSGLAELPTGAKVLFTAHSLPERVLAEDPYPEELQRSAAAIASAAGLGAWPAWGIAWQSAGATPEPWRGPDILEVLRLLGATDGATGVLVCAQGFTADHLEVLYDLDVEARAVAGEVGIAFARTAMPNDDASIIDALAERVLDAADAAADGATDR